VDLSYHSSPAGREGLCSDRVHDTGSRATPCVSVALLLCTTQDRTAWQSQHWVSGRAVFTSCTYELLNTQPCLGQCACEEDALQSCSMGWPSVWPFTPYDGCLTAFSAYTTDLYLAAEQPP
jgi:hypothetical protein